MENNTVQEDLGIITQIKKNIVTVEIQKGGGCKSCAAKSVCGGNENSVSYDIKTDLSLKIGDRVKVYVSSGVKLFSSFVIFIYPIIMMLIFYLIPKLLFKLSENISIMISVFGLFISGIVIYKLDKIFAGKIHFEIAEKIEN